MTPDDRREQRRQQTHQQLLDAAKEVFSQRGYDEASILDVTEAANLSKRTFYLHFPDKEALIQELAYLSFEEVRLDIEQEKMQENEPVQQGFHRMVRKVFEYAQANPDLLQIALGRDGSFHLYKMTRDYLVNTISFNINNNPQCRYIGEAHIPAAVIANAEAGLIFQLMCWWMQNSYPHTPAAMADMCVEILFNGVERYFISENVTSQIAPSPSFIGKE